MPYLPLGYPTPETCRSTWSRAPVAAGADVLELGVPFSDPLADGPTIQRATQVALEQGVTVDALPGDGDAHFGQGAASPRLVLMGYVNPILAYGQEAFCAACAEAGVDGLIVPDLPPEEGADLEDACRAHGLALVYLLAPTSTPERIALVVVRSTGFIYVVSVTGVTGARPSSPPAFGNSSPGSAPTPTSRW